MSRDKNPKVDALIRAEKRWQAEFTALREVILECPGLTEELKWNQPCYCTDGKNVVLILGLKEYCALLFPKGVLVKDPNGVLLQWKKTMQAARQIRFTRVPDILKAKRTTQACIREAMEVERRGLKVVLKKTEDFEVPAELESRLRERAALRAAFQGLTPGRQRGYLHFFSSAKQSATRAARVEKCIPRILKGLGLTD